MVGILDDLLGSFRRKVRPTETVGAPGMAVFGGFVQETEKDGALIDRERYRTFSEILVNTSIAAAGTRYFLNLIAGASWTFEPSDADVDGRFAELAEEMLTDDPSTPWHRIVRRAAMYRFYGFSVQEWTARRRDDGLLTYADVAPRAQMTIERWDIDDNGIVNGIVQRNPQNSQELYLPREKVVYMVDDTLSDSPTGLGLFRHIVAPARRLERYEQLEGFGFETDLRGIPIGRGPFTELARMVTSGEITQEQRIQAEAPIRDFIKNHIKGPKLGMLLDSITYQTTDEKGAPSSQKQWDVELLKGSPGSLKENAAAIERLNREIARTLGVEGLLIGGDGTGSLALSQDKSQNLFLIVESTLTELREQLRDDLLWRVWQLNGWDPTLMPKMKTQAVQHRDVEQITRSLKDIASAGAMLDPTDPVVNDVRSLLGVSTVDTHQLELDLSLTGREAEGSSDDEDDMPTDETSLGREV